jgi:uncharacterized alpha-E superfamily protein
MAKRTASNRLRQLAATLAEDSAEDLIARGMHEGLDEIQVELAEITKALGHEYFLLADVESSAAAPEQ